jgi:hypothetical protein
VKVLTTAAGGHRRTVDGITVIYYGNLSNFLAYRYRVFSPIRMFREAESEFRGADIVHIHELRSTITPWASKASRRLSLPYVLSTHGGLRRLGRRACIGGYHRFSDREGRCDAYERSARAHQGTSECYR